MDFTNGVLVIHVLFTARARVTSHIRCSQWDGIDREYLPLGNASIVTDETIEMEALVSLDGNIPDYMKIKDVEIMHQGHRLELGEVRPDWTSNPDNFDSGSPDDIEPDPPTIF